VTFQWLIAGVCPKHKHATTHNTTCLLCLMVLVNLLYRVSSDFISVLQDLIPETIPGQKYRMINGYRYECLKHGLAWKILVKRWWYSSVQSAQKPVFCFLFPLC